MTPESKDVESVIREALNKHEKSRLEHGHLTYPGDRRDFMTEAEQELLDCINYYVFQILRLRRITC